MDPAVLRFKALAAEFEAKATPEERAAAAAAVDEFPDFASYDTRGSRFKPQESRKSRSPSPRRSRSRSRSRSPRRKKDDYSDSDSGPELVTSQTYGRKPERKAPPSKGGRERGGFGSSRGSSRSSSAKTLRVPNDKVSIIIGKGGSQIKEIQANTGAQIKIPDATQTSSEREITIIGSEEQQQRAMDAINQIIQDRSQRGPMGGSRGGPSSGGFRNEIKFELQIPSDKVGLLIGKGGATINEIKQQSGAHISVQREASTGPTTQVVISAKTQDVIDNARQLIDEKISGNRDGGRGGPRGGGRYGRENYEQDQARYGRENYDQDQGRYGRDSYDQDQGRYGRDSHERDPGRYDRDQGRYDRDQGRYDRDHGRYDRDSHEQESRQGGYYSNQQQGEHRPHASGETIGDWTSCVDPKTGFTYWANLKTGESSWDRPSQ